MSRTMRHTTPATTGEARYDEVLVSLNDVDTCRTFVVTRARSEETITVSAAALGLVFCMSERQIHRRVKRGELPEPLAPGKYPLQAMLDLRARENGSHMEAAPSCRTTQSKLSVSRGSSSCGAVCSGSGCS
jgi:hypothetical protein